MATESRTEPALVTAAPRAASASPSRSIAQRWFAKGWLWVVVLVAVFTVPLVRTLLHPYRAPLPVLWQMPDWRLTDQNGATFGARELAGQVYVADFIFTSCSSSCPRLTARMAALQARVHGLGRAVHLVSISVDPTTDTPERLRAYAANYHADLAQWTFVTGNEAEVVRAVTQGFREGLAIPPRGPNGDFNGVELAHSNRFALVDARGQLRGSYVALDEAELDRLATDIRTLASEQR